MGRSSGDPSSEILVTPVDDPQLPPSGFFKGMLPNPNPSQTFEEVYENVSLHSQFAPVWGKPSPFYNLSTDLAGPWGDIFVEDLIRGNGMFPLIHMSFFGKNMSLMAPPEMISPTLSDSTWRELYIRSAKDIVNASKPKYLSIGNEVNRWFEEYGADPGDDNGFQHYVSLYNETYDAVKSLSPETDVFCTFSREMVSKHQEANMSVLDMFDPDRLDLLVLTTYPHSVQGINRVFDIPDEYYSSVLLHTGPKKVGFSEAAWPSIPDFGGEREQSAFIKNITGRLTFDQGLDLELLGWPWLHDIGPTDSTGLRYNDGTPKSALTIWKNNTEPTYDRNNRTISLEEDFIEYIYDLGNTFSDPDPGDTLTYTLWNGTEYTNYTNKGKLNASIVDNTLVLTSYDNVSGNVQLRIRASDRMRDTNWTFFMVTIDEVNDPPALLSMGKVDIYEDVDSIVPLSTILIDAEDPISILNITITSSSILGSSIGFTTAPVLFLDPPPEWYGTTTVSIRVKDSDGADVNFDLKVTVIPVEDPPKLDVPTSLEMDEDSTLKLDVTGWWQDTDPGDLLNVTLNSSIPDDLEISLSGTQLEIRSLNDWHGTAILYLNVSDGKMDSFASIYLEIRSINDPPEYLSPDIINMTEDTDLYFDMDNIAPFDRENEVIIYTFERSSDVIRTVVFLENGTMRISPWLNAYGIGNFTISMRDPSGGITYVEFPVSISPVNDPPYLFCPSNWTLHMKRGETKVIDLGAYPCISEDVDDLLDEVNLITDCQWCTGNSTTLIITIPEETDITWMEVTFYLEDGKGGISETRNFSVHVLDPVIEEPEKAVVFGMNISIEEGEIIVTLEGNSDQELWLVLTGPLGDRTSKILVEDLNSPGHYYLKIEGPDLEKGDLFKVHVSLTNNGGNDSDLPVLERIYTWEVQEPGQDDEEENFPILFLILGGSVFVIILALIYLMIRKGNPLEEE